ncbi:MAG: hypothetical protein WBG73_24095 [Coleofasciculaceae cyanobacterium]
MKIKIFPLVGSALLGLINLTITTTKVSAQSVTPCEPPQSQEYVLFVLNKAGENQEQMRRALPANTLLTRCRYFSDVITRISGFRRIEDAQSWALYVQDIIGLSAVVVRPATARVTNNSPSVAYNPKPLGEGYAVLVDYFNKPEVAAQVRRIVGKEVGLVSYNQRPYLLAVYTDSQRQASSTLRELSDRGFSSMVVDSRRVTLLRQRVGI